MQRIAHARRRFLFEVVANTTSTSARGYREGRGAWNSLPLSFWSRSFERRGRLSAWRKVCTAECEVGVMERLCQLKTSSPSFGPMYLHCSVLSIELDRSWVTICRYCCATESILPTNLLTYFYDAQTSDAQKVNYDVSVNKLEAICMLPFAKRS